jgi:crossover junction endodeoxyribonuclease RusA
VTARIVSFPQPARALTMNQRLHWTERARLTADWREAAGWAAIAQLGRPPARRACPPSEVLVVLPVSGRHRRDPHNWHPTVKAIVDGLVDAGCWPDDTPDWVTIPPPQLDLGRTDVQVIITPISGDAA